MLLSSWTAAAAAPLALLSLLATGLAGATPHRQQQEHRRAPPSVSPPLLRRATASVSAGDQGTFIGNVVGDQEQYYGIPFAEPPARFKQPQPVQPYSGVGPRDATQTGHVCWQSGSGYKPPVLDEDCLVLNIYKPASATASSKLPVMVWIYGGGWQVGSSISPTTNATALVDASIASQQPIIFVSIQYRVGVFGFIGGKDAAAAAQAGTVDLNAGLYDQRQALRWIQKYISYFGGDPTRVTAFGQSAGAASVSTHMIANGGQLGGLFSGAIMQSGSASNYPRFYPGDDRPQQIYSDLLAASNCADLACLQNLDASMLNQAQAAVIKTWVSAFVPVIDPYFYPTTPSFAFKTGAMADIPFITGTCLDDGTLIRSARNVSSDADFADFIARQYGNQTAFGIGLLSQLYSPDPADGCPFRTELFGVSSSDPIYSSQYKRSAAVINDLLFLAPKRMQLYGALNNPKKFKSSTWSYLFAQRGPASIAGTGVAHGSDVRYVFAQPPTSNSPADSNDGSDDGFMRLAESTPDADDVAQTSQMMVASWLAFAYRRDPNANGVPNWPAYDLKNMASMQWQGSNTTVIPDTFRKLQTDMFLANPFTYWI
ncbi:hypothetical protein OC842_000127 [Tilletia horrida]|uniref:Carboxylesterase type B domain-containing protein n=1 Tax=Tilletia horrida TaxID=155126 RepID=A0AAN6JPY0_9BASI|nr:hypothetical protein OC842_000127 [Tilletia horrida]